MKCECYNRQWSDTICLKYRIIIMSALFRYLSTILSGSFFIIGRLFSYSQRLKLDMSNWTFAALLWCHLYFRGGIVCLIIWKDGIEFYFSSASIFLKLKGKLQSWFLKPIKCAEEYSFLKFLYFEALFYLWLKTTLNL